MCTPQTECIVAKQIVSKTSQSAPVCRERRAISFMPDTVKLSPGPICMQNAWNCACGRSGPLVKMVVGDGYSATYEGSYRFGYYPTIAQTSH